MAITRRHFVGGALAASASVAVGRQSIGRPKSSDLNFLIIGDWGDSGSVGQRRVAAAMKNATSYAPPRFVASVGDNFYPRGVNDPIDEAWLNSYERVYDPVALGCPWYAILGNHDHKGSVAAQVKYSEKSRRWVMPSAYYRRIEPISSLAEAEFFYLDTTPLVSQQPSVWSRWISGPDPDEQVSWLESCLRSSSAVWKIVVGHHPIVSAGPHGASPELVERLKPLLEKYGVQAYFNGHDHNLQHATSNGVHYFTSGAGSRVRAPDEIGRAKHCYASLGFMAAKISETTMSVEIIDSDGRVLHAAAVSRTSK